MNFLNLLSKKFGFEKPKQFNANQYFIRKVKEAARRYRELRDAETINISHNVNLVDKFKRISVHDYNLVFSKRISNSDSILSKHGTAVYKDMVANDAAIDNLLKILVSSIFAGSFRVESDNQRFVDLISNTLGNKFFNDIKRGVKQAFTEGTSFNEILWIEKDGFLIPSKIIPHDVNALFEVDDYKQPTGVVIGKTVYPLEKFLILKGNDVIGTPFGRSILRPTWKVYFTKSQCIEKGVLFVDKLVLPHLLLEYIYSDVTQSYITDATETDIDSFVDDLQNLEETFGLIIPKGFKLNTLDLQTQSSQIILNIINFCNKEMSRAIIGTELINSEAQFGTRAQAIVHQAVSGDIIQDFAQQIANDLIDQLYKRTFELNNIKGNVKINFDLPDEGQTAKLDSYLKVYSLGYKIDKKILAETIDTQPESLSEIAVPSITTNPFMKFQEEIPKNLITQTSHKEFIKIFSRISRQANSFINNIETEIKSIVTGKLEGKDSSALTPRINLNSTDDFSSLEDRLLAFYTFMYVSASNFASQMYNRDKNLIFKDQIEMFQSLPDFKNLNELLKWYENNFNKPLSIDIINEFKEKVNLFVREIILDVNSNLELLSDNAKTEESFEKQAKRLINDIVFKFRYFQLQGKLTDLFNQNLDRWRKKNLSKDDVPVFQFIAVIDQFTTDICRELDGRFFSYDDPDIDKIRPPLPHYLARGGSPKYNICRSLWLPIDKTSAYDYRISKAKDFIELLYV